MLKVQEQDVRGDRKPGVEFGSLLVDSVVDQSQDHAGKKSTQQRSVNTVVSVYSHHYYAGSRSAEHATNSQCVCRCCYSHLYK